MKDIYVEESGMRFGPFEEGNFIHIEKSNEYQNLGEGVKMTEFIFCQHDADEKLISIEAKSSAPNPESGSAERPREKFAEYVDEIAEKMENSVDLYLNMTLKKAVPEAFLKIDYSHLKIILVLVIKDHKEEWLRDVNDALQKRINRRVRLNKIWKCSALAINDEMAARKGLIEDRYLKGTNKYGE